MSETSSKDTVLKTAMTYICGGKWKLQVEELYAYIMYPVGSCAAWKT